MTLEEFRTQPGDPSSSADGDPNPSDRELSKRFAPLFEEIAGGAAEREMEHRLPHAEMTALRKAGFGALRIPVSMGGHGATLRQLLGMRARFAIPLRADRSEGAPGFIRRSCWRVWRA